ncbi:hypothetical protein [Rariglobus hedericola]|uniref:Uncharacterized protein n=1 Tax=Rariglobus hedericola TaxID=2597822 RepID=A0A556QK55_9BACT|nr:hypothetical protein [Rariglobus hedericola]TSJ77007.1 hypothetical protein FPL22_12925 [Rariglobus hedericola]
MKFIATLFTLIVFTCQLIGHDLSLTDGRTLKNVKLRSMDASGITVIHDDGGDYVDYLTMTETDRTTFGYIQSRYEEVVLRQKQRQEEAARSAAAAKTASAQQPKPVSTTPSPQSSYSAPAYSSQCAATTKKGARCKRTAAAGSAYCWQHQ